MAKKYTVDDAVELILKALKTPKLQMKPPSSGTPIEQSISNWVNEQAIEEHRRSAWFRQLSEDDRKMIRNILEDCAEMTAASFFTLLDGVGGSYEGVFEVVAVSNGRRTVLNPQNTEMLHDIFSDVCEEDRRQTQL